jgi:DNA-directed RNA polymerase specialized sigma24 family protein
MALFNVQINQQAVPNGAASSPANGTVSLNVGDTSPPNPDARALLAFVVENHADFLWQKCKGICRRHGLRLTDADDLFSAVVCQIGLNTHTRRPPLNSIEEWQAFLGTIANHLVLSMKKGEARRGVRESAYAHDIARRKQALAAKALESNLIKEDIKRALEKGCDDRMQLVFGLWTNGFSIEEISNELGFSDSTAKRALYDALAIIRPMLQQRGW